MQLSVRQRYWGFQVGGWSVVAMINLFFAFIFDQIDKDMICRLIFFVEMGIILSHIMRITIRKNNVLILPINQQIRILSILTLL